jgi:hypothetical protein
LFFNPISFASLFVETKWSTLVLYDSHHPPNYFLQTDCPRIPNHKLNFTNQNNF